MGEPVHIGRVIRAIFEQRKVRVRLEKDAAEMKMGTDLLAGKFICSVCGKTFGVCHTLTTMILSNYQLVEQQKREHERGCKQGPRAAPREPENPSRVRRVLG